jgi:hypothetical protein
MFGGGWGGWQQGERAAEAATAGWLWVYLPFFWYFFRFVCTLQVS